jgi:1-acyl-sn-glycerol-3-phosphate acyltransferase
MSESGRTVDVEEEVAEFGATDASDLRLFLNRGIFRGFIFGAGALVTALHFVNRDLAWDTAKSAACNVGLATGVEVELRGIGNMPDEPTIITPNHASHFDIVALLGHLPGHNRFAAKQELFREPVLGTVMKVLGMVPIDRANPAESIERLNRLATKGEKAFSLVMFPEGTRSPAGGGMQPFKKGAFTLAIQTGRPVLPIAIYGTDEVMPRGDYLSIRPGRIVVEVLPSVPTEGLSYEDRESLRDRVRALILERLEQAGHK